MSGRSVRGLIPAITVPLLAHALLFVVGIEHYDNTEQSRSAARLTITPSPARDRGVAKAVW